MQKCLHLDLGYQGRKKDRMYHTIYNTDQLCPGFQLNRFPHPPPYPPYLQQQHAQFSRPIRASFRLSSHFGLEPIVVNSTPTFLTYVYHLLSIVYCLHSKLPLRFRFGRLLINISPVV